MKRLDINDEIQNKLWRLNALEECIDAVDEILNNAIEQGKITYQNDYARLLADLIGKTSIVFRQIICLVRGGYADGAMAFARTIYEQSIVLIWFESQRKKLSTEEFDDYVSDYFTAARFKRIKDIKHEAEAFEQTQLAEKCAEKLSKIKSTAKHPPKGWGDYWWSGHNSFSELSKSVSEELEEPVQGFFKSLNSGYKIACAEIHGGPAGNSFSIDQDKDFWGIDLSIHPERCGLPLWFSVSSFINIAGVALTFFENPNYHLLEVLNGLAWYYSNIRDEELKSRTDSKTEG